MKKVIVKLDIHDDKGKQKANESCFQPLSLGVVSLAIDMERKMTVIGDVDPIDVVKKLRKLWHAELVSVGPDKEPEKKEVKKDEGKKEDDKKKDENQQIQDLLKAYQNYNPYIMRPYVVQHSVEENPNACVIS